MGTVTKTIGTAIGRDYSTPQAWQDAMPANLVTDGNSQVGNLYNDSEFTASVVISGHTTDSTHTILMTAAPGQSFIDNAGVQTNPLRYDQSKGVGINHSNTVKLETTVDFVTVSRIQFQSNAQYAAVIALAGGGTGGLHQVFDQCIFEDINTGNGHSIGRQRIGDAGGGTYFRNCHLYTKAGAGLTIDYNKVGFFNCTFARSSDAGASGTALTSLGGAIVAKNSAFFGFSTSVSGGTQSGNNNASDVAISFGTSNQASKTYANQFVSAVHATRDFRVLNTSADIYNNGADLSAATPPVTVDIVDTARPQGSAYDIGAWELVVAGLTVLPGGAWGSAAWGRRAWGLPPLVAGGVNSSAVLRRNANLEGASTSGPFFANPLG